MWKRPKSENSTNASTGDVNDNRNPSWEPFATQNPSFDEYYKVSKRSMAKEICVFAYNCDVLVRDNFCIPNHVPGEQ